MNDNQDENIEEYFDEFDNFEPDNNNFSNPGSVIEFYDGDEDFIIPENTNNLEPPPDVEEIDVEEPDFDFELPVINLGFNSDQYFDYDYYLEQNPDVAATESTGLYALAGDAGFALTHFIEYGAAEGREYRSTFDNNYYLEQNPDVAAAGLDPYLHYLQFGKTEGREFSGTPATSPLDSYNNLVSVEELEEGIALAGGNLQNDSLFNLTESQGEEGINSSPSFDRDYYLEQNPDVAAAGLDPYLHYLQFGQAEGRLPLPSLEEADFAGDSNIFAQEEEIPIAEL